MRALYLFIGRTQNSPSERLCCLGSWLRRVISGEYGKIILDHFTKCEKVVLEKNFEAPLTVKFPHDVNGFEYVIREAESCIRRGDLESSRLPWVVTLENMRIMDRNPGNVGASLPM